MYWKNQAQKRVSEIVQHRYVLSGFELQLMKDHLS